MNAPGRTFEMKPAIRESVGLLIGLVGPSSSGKTLSALRLAKGIQSVCGGKIAFCDTENRRALYYADRFQFEHLNFSKPFSPDDYLAALRFCLKQPDVKTIIVDSGSHEHEGAGGVLEWHAAETDRLAALWKTSREKAQMAAWGPPKSARRRLINEVLQMNVNVVWTFRAKEKLRIVAGRDPVPLGWQPICGEEFMYEFALQCLLPPGSQGRPRWKSDLDSERAIMKLPQQFSDMFKDGDQLSEEHGRKLAEWAAGGLKLDPKAVELIDLYAKCEDDAAYKQLESKRSAVWKAMPPASKARVKAASDATLERINKPSGSNGDLLPPADAGTWVETLNACETLEQLSKTWDGCRGAFPGDVPNECDAAYQLRREALETAQGETA